MLVSSSFIFLRAEKYLGVIFIPKAGKPSHTKVNDYRLIILCSFLFKTLEIVFDAHITASIDPVLTSDSQHACMRGKSMETALHSLISRVEIREHTLAIFLDIEGAFSNVDPEVIALNSLNLGRNIVRFIELILKSRLVTTNVGATNCQRMVRKGTP